jgi:predicted exporter
VSRSAAHRYASWIDANRVGVLILSVLVAALCGYLGSRMPLRSDLSTLLPQSRRSVKDLDLVQDRARPFSTVHVVVKAADPALRERAANALRDRLARLPPELVIQFTPDDGPAHRYGWDHRFLFADLDDLIAARDALDERITRAKLEANPLYVPLDDDDAAEPDRLAELEAELDAAHAKALAPPPKVSADGQLQLLTIQASFPSSSYAQARRLLRLIGLEIRAVRAEVGGGVQIGLTGNATMTVHEHDSVLEGMWLSATITVLLCGIAMFLYYRSGLLVLAMLWALGVGVLATFAVARFLIGHLDMMSAFLAAIVVGNGINAGLILVARYLEEIRAQRTPADAVAHAIAGALRGTTAAMATAVVAYASLVITDFRGFRNFGAIAGIGMFLTFASTFVVLPAILFVVGRRGKALPSRPPAIGDLLARLLPRRLGITVAIGAALTAVAGVITASFIAGDPFTRDWRDLQSSTPAINTGRALDQELRNAFDSKSVLAGQAYMAVIAVEHRDQVRPLVERIRADDAARPPERRWLNDVRSLDDLLPPDQDRKLAVLAEIRALLDSPSIAEAMTADELAQLRELRPPDDLRPLTDADVPPELAWPFVEKDGSVGKLIVLRGSRRLKSFDVADRLLFAREVRGVTLPPGAVVAGEALIVADIIATMEHDTPLMVIFALAGSLIAVAMVIGLRRHGAVTLVCGLSGVVLMVAACALAGLRVHFLDLIALPLTIGIGIDYAANLAARDRQDGERGPHHLLRTTGGAVLMCSYTTAVGYGTLLLSANGGIRAFGLAALLGEITTLLMALLVGPALLAILRRREAMAPHPVP